MTAPSPGRDGTGRGPSDPIDGGADDASAVGPGSDPLLPVASPRPSWVRTAAAMAAFAVAVSLPLWVGATIATFLVDLAVLVAVAMWFGWLAGSVGRPVLAWGVFAGAGTYAWQLLVDGLDLNPVVALAAGAVAAGALGVATGAVVARLDATWTAAATLALGVAAADLASAAADGPSTVVRAAALNPTLRRSLATWLAVVVGVGSVAAVVALRRSRVGLSLAAARDDAEAARWLGVRTPMLTVGAVGVAAAAVGLAGAVDHLASATVDPASAFDLVVWTWAAVVAATVGGLRTVTGPIVGAGIVVTLQRVLDGRPMLYLGLTAVLVLATLAFAPLGIVGHLDARLGTAGRRRIRTAVGRLGAPFGEGPGRPQRSSTR